MGLADADDTVITAAGFALVHLLLLRIQVLDDPVLALFPVVQWKLYAFAGHQNIQHPLNIFEVTPQVLQLLANTLAYQFAARPFAFANAQISFTCLLPVGAGLLAMDCPASITLSGWRQLGWPVLGRA